MRAGAGDTAGWPCLRDEIDGIVVQTGCYTVSQMQVEDGWWPDHPIIPCAGESANGNRLQMLPVSSGIEGALGKSGQSIGSGLWAVGYTFRVAMQVLDEFPGDSKSARPRRRPTMRRASARTA